MHIARRGRIRLRLAQEHGLSLIELLVAMALTTVIMTAALALLQSVSANVAHTTERSEAQQRARLAMERIVATMHAGCVAPNVTPIELAPYTAEVKLPSGAGVDSSFGPNLLRFVTARSDEAIAGPVELLEFEYATATSPAEGHRLIERAYRSTGGTAPNWTFAAAPYRDRTIISHLTQSLTASGATIPVFQYYRYYSEAELKEAGSKAERGVLDPTPMSNAELQTEAREEEEAISRGEGRGNEVSKVLVTYTTEPRSHEATNRKDLPLPISDSVVFRVDPTSAAAGAIALPCT